MKSLYDSMGVREVTDYSEKDLKKKYLEDYLSKHPKNSYLRKKLSETKEIGKLYEKIREQEKKVPSLVIPEYKFEEIPSISLGKPLTEAVEVKKYDDKVTVYLDGISIVTYSKNTTDHIGRRVDIEEDDLKGHLYFNTDFFKVYDVPKDEKSGSDGRNIAKTLFNVDGKRHIALVQYLRDEGTSSEHYHTLEEIIVQLVGRSLIVKRPIEDDMNCRINELTEGDVYVTPPNYQHYLYTAEDQGSITIPIKQLIKGKSDRMYKPKSRARLEDEVWKLIHMTHYSNGLEMEGALEDYYKSLVPSERDCFKNWLDEKLVKDKNPNLIRILKGLRASLFS